jgi:hypothetical protein
MLRVYLLQEWYSLTDTAMKEVTFPLEAGPG